jgi:tight adherence protein C
MSEWFWMALSFVVVGGISLLILVLLRRSLVPSRPRRGAVGEEELALDPPGPDAVQKVLAAQLPMNETERQELSADLRSAGFYQPGALVRYAAVRGLLVLIPIAATAFLALSAPPQHLWRIFVGGAVGVVFGFGLPRLYLAYRSRLRRRDFERALPFTVDLLRLCLSAGGNLLQALGQVSAKLRYSHPTMAREIAITHQQAEIHSLDYALNQFSERSPLPEARNLALLLVQSERLGTDVAMTLQEFATHFRTTVRQRAEARANRTSFWMLLPCVYCLLPASVIILVGPAYQEFLSHTKQTPELFQKARQDIDRVNSRQRSPAETAAPTAGSIAP